jgi:phospho-N-acetylmuramoyl-pentapeptide-transferase
VLGLLASACVALAIGLGGTSWLIRVLRARAIGQPIHEAVVQHASKAGTPTMGGLCLSVAAPLGYGAGLVALGRGPSVEGLALVACIVAGGTVGALDDWLKVRRGRNSLGLRELQKTVLLLVVGAGVVLVSFRDPVRCLAPSAARCEPLPSIGAVACPLWALAVVWLTANAVNFADGLDGLLAGSAIPPLTLLTVIAFWQYRHPAAYATQAPLHLALVLAAVTAGCAGLLWWSAAPAQVFMGETGSLAIGCGIAVAALLLHVELLIPFFGALFVAEGLSSFAQRMWFKATRTLRHDHQPQRLFRMAPLHHHFELLWPETRVTIRFWIMSAIATSIAGAVFYADALRVLP